MIPKILPKCHKPRVPPVLAVDRAMTDAPEKGAAAISQGTECSPNQAIEPACPAMCCRRSGKDERGSPLPFPEGIPRAKETDMIVVVADDSQAGLRAVDLSAGRHRIVV